MFAESKKNYIQWYAPVAVAFLGMGLYIASKKTFLLNFARAPDRFVEVARSSKQPVSAGISPDELQQLKQWWDRIATEAHDRSQNVPQRVITFFLNTKKENPDLPIQNLLDILYKNSGFEEL